MAEESEVQKKTEATLRIGVLAASGLMIGSGIAIGFTIVNLMSDPWSAIGLAFSAVSCFWCGAYALAEVIGQYVDRRLDNI